MQHAAKTADATRYADALVALAEASGASEAIEQDLFGLNDFLKTSDELKQFLASTHVTAEGKERALQQILADRTHPILIHFVQMLQSQDELRLLPEVVEHFFNMVSNQRKQVSGEIVTAIRSSDEKYAAVEHEVGLILGKDVHLRPRISPGVVGGVYVKVGDFIIDGTVESQLDTIRRQLTN